MGAAGPGQSGWNRPGPGPAVRTGCGAGRRRSARCVVQAQIGNRLRAGSSAASAPEPSISPAWMPRALAAATCKAGSSITTRSSLVIGDQQFAHRPAARVQVDLPPAVEAVDVEAAPELADQPGVAVA